MATFGGRRPLFEFPLQEVEALLHREQDVDTIQIDDMILQVRRGGLGIRAFTGTKWPDGKVLYKYADSVLKDAKADELKAQFDKACKEWSAISKVSFAPRTTESGFILVEKAATNRATVGHTGKQQVFDIFNWDNHIIISHELGHTLGLTHEQSRSDRDKFVAIHSDNIIEKEKHNFAIAKNSINYSDYDFESIMHYGRFAFAIDTKKPTISAQEEYKEKEKLMGNRKKLSANDGQDMASHYGKPSAFKDMNQSRFTELRQRTVSARYLETGSSPVVIVLECESEIWQYSDGSFLQRVTATTLARGNNGTGEPLPVEVLTVQIFEPEVSPPTGPAAARRTTSVRTIAEWEIDAPEHLPVVVHGTISSSQTGDQALTERFFASPQVAS